MASSSSAARLFSRWRVHGPPLPVEAVAAPTLLAASCGSVVLLAAVGLGATGLALHYGRKSGKKLELINVDELHPLPTWSRATGSHTAWAYRGSDPLRQGALLRLRRDDGRALLLDAAATSRLGGRYAPQLEVVDLAPSTVVELLGREGQGQLKAGETPGLWQLDALPEAAVTLLIAPGRGLVSLYGQPGAFTVQEHSLLRRDELSRAGRYNPQDLFSGRVERLQRALTALVDETLGRAEPAGSRSAGSVQVHVDGQSCSPGEELTLLEQLGGGSTTKLVELLLSLLQPGGSPSPLLTDLLRAQCGAGPGIAPLARELYESLLRHTGAAAKAPFSPEELLGALERGFWTLAPDQSGMHQREREAERLLERCRRELWIPGSASRLELEVQIRHFLCRYLLGCAASEAWLQLTLVKGGAAEELLRRRFTPQLGRDDFWARLELVPLEVPLAASLLDA